MKRKDRRSDSAALKKTGKFLRLYLLENAGTGKGSVSKRGSTMEVDDQLLEATAARIHKGSFLSGFHALERRFAE